MVSEKDFDRDAALLAGMVGGHLNYIDKITDSKSTPANRIQIDNFIRPLRGGPAPTGNPYDPANRGYISEQQVKNMQPDINVSLAPEIQTSEPVNVVAPVHHVPQQTIPTTPITNSSYAEMEDDIKSIKATLQHIDATFTKIAGMMGKVFNFITEKEKSNK